MKGAYPDVFFGCEDGESFFHFLGGFVGECQSGNLRRIDTLMQQSGNAMGNDAGFSAAGTGKDKEGTFDESHGLLLGFVESFEEVSGDFGFFHAIIITHKSRNETKWNDG